MIKTRGTVLFALALLSAAISVHGQGTGTGGGCVDSPEAPTALLMLVGSVGLFCGPFVLRKVRSRSGKR